MEWLRRWLGLPPGGTERARLEAKARADGEEMMRLTRGGDHAGALRLALGVMPLLRRLWAFADLARAHENAGHLSRQLGRRRLALKHHRKAAALWKRVGDRRGLALSLASIGRILIEADEHDRARNELTKACEIFESLGDDEGLAEVLASLVGAVAHLGLHAERLEAAQRLLAASERLGDDERLAGALLAVGLTRQESGDHAEGVEMLQRALPLAADDETRLHVLWGLTECFTGQGAYERALQLLDEALALARRCGDRASQCRLLGHRGAVQCRAGLVAEARRSLEDALRLAPNPGDQAQVLMNLGALHLQENELDDARRCADRAHAIFEAGQDFPGMLSALYLRQRAAARRGPPR